MSRKALSILFFIFISMSVLAQAPADKPLAFPGADGFGKYTSGGRNGRVIAVTNLNDDGPGSFRNAVSTVGSRMVIFRVSGTIQLKKELTIFHPNLTIAGQSAPGEGICIAGAPVHLRANNIIVRFLRFRLGDRGGKNANAFTAIGYTDIIIDHCSFSWATGENLKIYNNADFTMQWCLVSESLYKPGGQSEPQGYGALLGGMKATFHHNLFAHNAEFSPNFSGALYHHSTRSKELVDFRNNIIYNWGSMASYGGEGGNFNVTNNYYKPGQATQKNRKAIILTNRNYGQFYLKGNVVFSNDAVSGDNWKGVDAPAEVVAKIRIDKEFPFVMSKTQSAENAYIDILAKTGASLKRDDVDSRIIQSTGTGVSVHGDSYGKNSGIIDSQASVNGWPKLKKGTSLQDSDGDGIPDEWEESKRLNLNDSSDGNAKTLNKNYTNIEVYLNDLVKDVIK